MNQSKRQHIQQVPVPYRGMKPATAPLHGGGVPAADDAAARTCQEGREGGGGQPVAVRLLQGFSEEAQHVAAHSPLHGSQAVGQQ